MNFLDGSERWGTIKSDRVLGRYTFEEFDQLTKERGIIGEFSPYEFRMEKE